jgi:serine/threonine protein phosphatase 1
MQFRPRFKAHVPRPAKGERVYAVGDVHGRHDLLVQLLDKVIRHYPTLTPTPSKITLLFLGDIIDRGPDSRRCIELIKRLVETAQAKLLLGNHEDMLLASIDGDGLAQQAWMRNGGLATLESYGVKPPQESEDAFDFAARLKEGIPPDHVHFLRSLGVSYSSGTYFFVHAGVRPGVRISRQEHTDLYSIREEFTQSEKWHGQVVVHGHSIVDEVDVRPNRIACDTAAYETGRLSCVCLQDANVSVIST